jgi:folate receptor
MLRYFQIGADGNIQNVPICAEYCDAWFDACQDDFTCFENWLEEYDPSLGITTCPASFTCRTFRDVYRDGRGLCDTIWGTVYAYSADADNCTVMAFNNTLPNPNYDLTFPRSGNLSKLNLGPTWIMSALLIFLLITADIC